jgi:hypothetical protein
MSRRFADNNIIIIYSRNSYPTWLIEQKIKIFLVNDKKPPREETFHTFCLDYNSHRVDFYAKHLMKKITPDIHVVGHSKRMLEIRPQEHNQPSKSLGVLEHILNCETYKNRKKHFLNEFKNILLPLKLTELQKEIEFYSSHYSILQKKLS